MSLSLKHMAMSAATAVIISSQAFGGQIVKNGGAIVTGNCYVLGGVSITATELLDFYEAKVLRAWHVALGDPTASVEDKVEMMLTRLEQVDPARTAVIRGWLESFDQERGWLNNGAQLPTVDDVGEITQVLPSGCFVKQAAGQRLPDNPPFDPYYIINTSWWNQLDNDSRAGLIVHELIYRDGIRRGHTDSIATRFLTSLLATNLIDAGAITSAVYDGILYRNRFDSYNYFKFRLYPESPVGSDDDAKNFCTGLAADGRLPLKTGRDYLQAGSYLIQHVHFKEGAMGRYLLSLPPAQRLFRIADMVIRLTPEGFDEYAEDQQQNAPALCYLHL